MVAEGAHGSSRPSSHICLPAVALPPQHASVSRLAIVAAFASAFLLFWGELLAGKLLLPVFGGAPSVFVTSLLVFQALLLGGYALAAALTRGRATRARFAAQALMLGAAVAMGAPTLARLSLVSSSWHPIAQVIVAVLGVIGVPFFALSVHAPLLQRWLSWTRSPRARDPYFLYVASNAGSFAGLLAFPLVLEPLWSLDEQARAFQVVLIVTALLTACLLLFTPLGDGEREPEPAASRSTPRGDIAVVLLGALPALHLGATTLALSLDLAAVPLLWVLPLAAYLLSFVVAFSSWGPRATRAAARALPFALIALTFILATRATEPALLILALHLGTFFVGAVLCHGHVAQRRPEPRALTRYYLMLSIGGAAGGAMAAVVAPLVFTSLVEIPLALALLPLAAPRVDDGARSRARDRAFDVLVPVGIVVIGAAVVAAGHALGLTGAAARLMVGVPVGLLIVAKGRPPRLALALAGVFALGAFLPAPEGDVLRTERSFFGVHRIVIQGAAKKLYQGTTEHGSQSLDPARRHIAGAYFHPLGPGGEVLDHLRREGRARDVLLIGLGAGALAAYADAGSTFTFLEIDAMVAHLAEHEFTFLTDARARGATVDVRLGDGRQLLFGAHDVVVIDAFTSGAVPVHLLTREAMLAMRAALRPHGVLLMHISNRHLDLESVIARLAQELGLAARTRVDLADDGAAARAPSQWVVLAARDDELAFVNERWRPLEGAADAPLFTDQRSNLVQVLRR